MAWYLTQSVYPISDDPGNNRRLYRTDVYLNASGNNSYSGYSTSGGGSVDGQGFSFTGPSAASLSNSSVVVNTSDFWVYGDANGYHGTVSASAWFQGSGGFSPPYITASASTGGFDWDRKPSTPSSVTATVNVDKTITVTSAAVSSPAGTPTYYFAYQANGGSWSAAESNGSSVTKVYTLTPGQNYAFRVYATNTDGTGGTTTSSSVFLPSGGKIYNGTAWVPTTVAKIYNGTAWVDLSTAKIYNGTSWVNLT